MATCFTVKLGEFIEFINLLEIVVFHVLNTNPIKSQILIVLENKKKKI